MPEEPQNEQPLNPQKKAIISSSKLLQLVCAALIIALGIVMLLWKPWQVSVKASDRIISVTGEATVTATPDQYIFTPAYQFSDPVSQTALTNLTTKSDEITTKLKALGVASSAIKSDSGGYTNGVYIPIQNKGGQTTYSLNFTITLTDKTLAQKVQNYLVTTAPTGSVSPE